MKLHFHLRGKARIYMGVQLPVGDKSPQIFKTREEADKALYEQFTKYPDLAEALEVVPCTEEDV